MKRPHLKQEFVSQWQADFNSIADELQDDEETKAELHQRVTVSKWQKLQYNLDYYFLVYKLDTTSARWIILLTSFFLFTVLLKLCLFLLCIIYPLKLFLFFACNFLTSCCGVVVKEILLCSLFFNILWFSEILQAEYFYHNPKNLGSVLFFL